jgi:hypothetical protein
MDDALRWNAAARDQRIWIGYAELELEIDAEAKKLSMPQNNP